MDVSHSQQQPAGKLTSILIAYGPGELQFAELHLPAGDGPHPTVILIHGGFWRARYKFDLMTTLADDLASRGIAAWNIEYRRVGDKDGGWPGTFLDVGAAADHLRVLAPKYHLDLKRVVSIGHSAGGHLAFWLAARPRIPEGSLLYVENPLPLTGVISQAGVVDLELAWKLELGRRAVVDLLSGTPATFPERYESSSPAALLPLGIPQVIIHGDEDINVPLQVSEVYTQAARAAGDPVKLIALKGVEHFALIDPTSEAWAKTIEALQSLL